MCPATDPRPAAKGETPQEAPSTKCQLLPASSERTRSSGQAPWRERYRALSLITSIPALSKVAVSQLYCTNPAPRLKALSFNGGPNGLASGVEICEAQSERRLQIRSLRNADERHHLSFS